MRTMSDKCIRTAINTQLSKITCKICRQMFVKAFTFMAMMAHEYHISLTFCFFNSTHNTSCILLIHLCNCAGIFIRFKANITYIIAADNRFCKAFFFIQQTIGINLSLFYNFFQLSKIFRLNLMYCLITQYIRSGTPQNISARITCHTPFVHC